MDRVLPYMVNRGEAYAALYSPFTLTLDGITVISVLSHSTQLCTIRSTDQLFIVKFQPDNTLHILRVHLYSCLGTCKYQVPGLCIRGQAMNEHLQLVI